MRLLKKLTLLLIIFCLFSVISPGIFPNNVYANSKLTSESSRKTINAGVSLCNFNDPYMSTVKKSLESVENQNKNIINFTFLDGKNNQVVQNETIDKLFNDNYDLLLINLVDAKTELMEYIVNRAKKLNKPVILFNVEPPFVPSSIRNYSKTVIIGTDTKQSGTLEGKILVDIWNANRRDIDKNSDNILEYVMLEGKADKESFDRSKYSISAIKEAGIQAKELASVVCDWDQNLAKSNVEALISRFGNNIEAIISNNDSMAIGAIEALQEYGYNKGDKSKNIIIVGIDGIPEARELVNKGIMSGTVIQDPNELARALYTIGINLVNDLPPLRGTNYKFNETGVTIEMPYYKYETFH